MFHWVVFLLRNPPPRDFSRLTPMLCASHISCFDLVPFPPPRRPSAPTPPPPHTGPIGHSCFSGVIVALSKMSRIKHPPHYPPCLLNPPPWAVDSSCGGFHCRKVSKPADTNSNSRILTPLNPSGLLNKPSPGITDLRQSFFFFFFFFFFLKNCSVPPPPPLFEEYFGFVPLRFVLVRPSTPRFFLRTPGGLSLR